MTIGDVLAAVAGIIGLGVSGWALLVMLALLCAGFAAKAQGHLENAPGAAFGTGLALIATLGLLAIALLNGPNALIKLIGWLLLLVLIFLSALGASGLALLLRRRIRGLEPDASEFRALHRGAAMLVLAGLMPVLGWFVVTPLVIITSLGASSRTLWQTRRAAAPSLPTPITAPAPVQANPIYPFVTTLPAPASFAPPQMFTLSDEPQPVAASNSESV